MNEERAYEIDLADFREIPEYPGYYINRNGILVSINRGSAALMKPYKSYGETAYVIKDYGASIKVSAAELLRAAYPEEMRPKDAEYPCGECGKVKNPESCPRGLRCPEFYAWYHSERMKIREALGLK